MQDDTTEILRKWNGKGVSRSMDVFTKLHLMMDKHVDVAVIAEPDVKGLSLTMQLNVPGEVAMQNDVDAQKIASQRLRARSCR